MGKVKDIAGQRFGRLKVCWEAGLDYDRHMKWLCECDCGKEVIVRGSDLRKGKQVSCGCYKRENASLIARTHGMSNNRIYHIWNGIKDRCNRPTNHAFKYYGGRGITLCDAWLDFEAFMSWAFSHGYDTNLTIERIDVNGNYEPENCKWISLPDQAMNTRKTHYITIGEETLPLTMWEKRKGHSKGLINGRLRRGFSEEDAVNLPKLKKQALRYITFKGKKQTVAKWSKELGIPSATIRRRIDVLGWSEDKALSCMAGKERERDVILEYDGKKLNMTEWSKLTGIAHKTISERIKRGWSTEKTLTTPTIKKQHATERSKNNTLCQSL